MPLLLILVGQLGEAGGPPYRALGRSAMAVDIEAAIGHAVLARERLEVTAGVKHGDAQGTHPHLVAMGKGDRDDRVGLVESDCQSYFPIGDQ